MISMNRPKMESRPYEFLLQLCCVDLKRFINLKLRIKFYSVGILRTSSPEGSIFSDCERTALRRRSGEPGYTEAL